MDGRAIATPVFRVDKGNLATLKIMEKKIYNNKSEKRIVLKISQNGMLNDELV
jgi:hypothetical protein